MTLYHMYVSDGFLTFNALGVGMKYGTELLNTRNTDVDRKTSEKSWIIDILLNEEPSIETAIYKLK